MVSKLNANRAPGESFGAATSRIYKDIGFKGLWNGLPVRIVMIGTLTGLQWLIYDSFKILLGYIASHIRDVDFCLYCLQIAIDRRGREASSDCK